MPGGSDACGGCLPTAAATGWITNAWVPALEVSQQIVPALLGMLHEAGVPGYAAPAHLAGRRLKDGTARPEKLSAMGRRQRLRRGRDGVDNRDAVPHAGGGPARRQRMVLMAGRRITGAAVAFAALAVLAARAG